MSRTLTRDNFGAIFDADNHYWETRDAFTRYRNPRFKDRGVRLVEHEGKIRYFIGSETRPFEFIPGPGDIHPRPVPGSLFDYFAGRSSVDFAQVYAQDPVDHPEYFHRDARLKTMDDQGVEAAWMFPSQAIELEGPMQEDVEACMDIFTGFNRWLDDEWGFAYKNRIFSVPLLSLTDIDLAVRNLEWALERGARLVTTRHGPVFTRDGYKSPADPVFDPFWARVQEANITVALHGGQERSYGGVVTSVADAWGIPYDPSRRLSFATQDKTDFSLQFLQMLQKWRLIHDHAAAVITHGLFNRFPRLRMAYVEFGALWVPPLLHALQVAHGQHPGMFERNPVDQFHENCWVAPFVEDNVTDLAKHIPVDRILFGSDWPHGEGVEHPRDFFDSLDGFSDADVRKIMLENARGLTFA